MKNKTLSGSKDYLLLDDGTIFHGTSFGYSSSSAGEVVFSTGMTGYTESLTDPSFYGQILTLTYPLIGNYGVGKKSTLRRRNPFESERIQVNGLIIADYSPAYDHWNADKSLGDWLKEEKISALCGIDTRSLTRHLRSNGVLTGKIIIGCQDIPTYDPNAHLLQKLVSIDRPRLYGTGDKNIALIDCGCKKSIISELTSRGVRVTRLPWNAAADFDKFDGLVISSGPGDPMMCTETIELTRKAMEHKIPLLGICLGHQIMALAAGAKTYKLKYGHRGQNQPVKYGTNNRCFITSQNHGFAVDSASLPDDWKPLFHNLNDQTNEGIVHKTGRFFSVQFHPEAAPGPYDTGFLFDVFLKII